MGFYQKHVLPFCLNKACGVKPISKQRQKIVPLASGRVLEIGIGSGLNLPHYNAENVTEIIGVDPDDHIWKRSKTMREACPIPVRRIGLSGEQIPMDDNTVDSVVVTYALCTIPDPVRALREMARILKPGGAIYFSEHGMAPDVSVQKWQGRIDPLWKKLAGGCHSGRDIPDLFQAAGIGFEQLEQMYIPGPKVLSYNYWGIARP
ncbi:class I SAM-dependent methyltransferase [Fretibacter rubidus]|uniref:class I SAM-dependent methyltransferase n=1 Tax=Fretibacter rubidus TaxID=570162 RepID=UPI00352AB927